MNLGQTIITLGAFVLMSTVILGMNTSFVENGKSIDEAQHGIMSLSLATSYLELASGLPFDEKTIDQFYINPGDLTSPGQLGTEADSIAEVDVSSFDDFDDFNDYEEIVVIGGPAGVPDSMRSGSYYKLLFDVYYVSSADVNAKSPNRTFLKRLDVKVLRIFPEGKDTVKASHIMGYWHFD